jgi:hypothetical protein
VTRWYISETDYPAVRRVMGPDRERMSDEELEDMLEHAFPESEPGEVESFMKSIQKFARQAAPIVQRVAPSIAKGAMSGAAVGGPWGALIGGLGGGAGTLLSGGLKPPAPGRGPAPAPAPRPMAAPAPAMGPAAVAGAGASGPAAAQLLTLLSRPETMQALLAILMGQAGRTSIPLGERHVPATAFADALSELASEAAGSAGTSGYWFDPQGEPRCDLANPRSRAALLWRDMAEAAEADPAGWSEEAEVEEEEESYEGDALDSFEAALAGEYFDDD